AEVGNPLYVSGKRIAIACAVAVAVAAAVASVLATGRSAGTATARPAAAQSPCAKRLIRDWSDGRIDGSYPVACYRAALHSLPSDLQVYSTAPEDIRQAL